MNGMLLLLLLAAACFVSLLVFHFRAQYWVKQMIGHLYDFFSEMFVMKSWGIDEHITL